MPKIRLFLLIVSLIIAVPGSCFAGTLIGDYNILPETLPEGFLPVAGTKSVSGTYVVAGSFQNRAAYLEISKNPDGTASVAPVQFLQSLDAASGGIKQEGLVRDVYVGSAGQLEFVGHSKTPNLVLDPGAGEATVWTQTGIPTALGFLPGAIQSQAIMGSRNGIYVGETTSQAVLFSPTAAPVRLSSGAFSIAGGVSKDGLVITGSNEDRLVYWTATIAGADYIERSVQMPDGGFDNGGLLGVEGDWLVGYYFSETLLDYTGAIWNVADGSVVRDFVAQGPIVDAMIETVDGLRVAGFNTAAGGVGPFLYVEGDSEIISVASLFHDLSPELGAIAQLVDIFPGTLSVLALTTTGQYVFASFLTSGGNIPPEPVPEPCTLMLLGSGLLGLHQIRRRSGRFAN